LRNAFKIDDLPRPVGLFLVANRAAEIKHLRIRLSNFWSVVRGNFGVPDDCRNRDGRFAMKAYDSAKLVPVCFRVHFGPHSGSNGSLN